MKFSPKSYKIATPLFIIIFSILIISLSLYLTKSYTHYSIEKKFDLLVSAQTHILKETITDIEQTIQYGVAFFNASDTVHRNEWQLFTHTFFNHKYPFIGGFGYIQFFKPEEKSEITKKMRSEGYEHFIIKPETDRNEYSSILFLEPETDQNKALIGYDLLSEATQKEAISSAINSGTITLSYRNVFKQTDDTNNSLLFYLPVHKIPNRQETLSGLIFGVSSLTGFLDNSLLNNPNFEFEIFDTSDVNSKYLLYRSDNAADKKSLYTIQKSINIYNHTWSINFFSNKSFERAQNIYSPWLITFLIFLIYVILLMFTIIGIKNRKARKTQARKLYMLSQALEQNPNTAVITDLDGKIEYVNNAFCKSSGYTKEEVIGKTPSILNSGKTPVETFAKMWTNITEGNQWTGEFVNRRKDGSEYIESVYVLPIFAENGSIEKYMAVKDDITQKKENEAHIQYLANFDALTNLPNRLQLMTHLQHEISRAKRNKSKIAVIFLDIDRFKEINDTLGHQVGDKLLFAFAKRIKSILRGMDMGSRIGGDEFIFVFPETDVSGIISVAQKILQISKQPFTIDEHELLITVSIGIAVYPHDGENGSIILKNADTAMYRAKQLGRNNFAFYTKKMHEESIKKLNLTNALHHALKNNELSIVYQPQVDIVTNHIVGAEALLRWKHPELGDISPAEFIPLAEESGLIIPIGEWVLHEAIQQCKRWITKELFSMPIAVNLSALQFRHTNLIQVINDLLKKFDLPSEFLELELTESIAMHDPENAIIIMSEFQKKGIQLSMDDFGTGYSSLTYLKRFQLSKLKIDQSFVRDMSTDPDDKILVATIIKMAKSLGMKTIAEGVETIEQLWYLRQQKCDEIQGYLYSRPLPPEEFEAFYLTHKKLQ